MLQIFKKQLAVSVFIVLLLASVLTVQAQTEFTEDELNLLTYIETVMNDMNNLTSYTAMGETLTDQLITVVVGEQEQTVAQILTQQIDGQFARADDESWQSDMTLVQNVVMNMEGQPETSIDQTLEMVIVDDGFFVRVSEVQPAELASLFPDDWANLLEDPFAFPGAEALNAEQLIMTAQSPITFPLDETTVLSIETLEPDSIDGETINRYSITVDGAALFATDAMQQQLSGFNTEAMGVDMETLLDIFGKGSNVSYILWIDDKDTLRRLEGNVVSSVDMAGAMTGAQSMLLTQTVTTSLTFGDFGAEFEIVSPVGE
jgi:hypothetical protein